MDDVTLTRVCDNPSFVSVFTYDCVAKKNQMFRYIYFDGSLAAMGNLLWAVRQSERVWVILSSVMLYPALDRLQIIVSDMEDIGGSLCHFEDGKLISHISIGLRDQLCECLVCPEEAFFELVCQMDEVDQKKILEQTHICESHPPCRVCKHCTLADQLGKTYGMYDVLDMS